MYTMQTNDQWVLLSKGLAGEASPDEMQQLQLVLDANPGLKDQYESMRLFWQQPVREDKQAAELAFEQVWKRIEG